MNSSGYNSLIGKLDRFIRRYYTNQMIRGSLYFIALGLGSFLIVALLEYFGRFSSTLRTWMFFLFLGFTLFLLVRFILVPAVKIFRLGKIISHAEAALIIGRHFPEVEDKLLNTLQLHQQSQQSDSDTSLIVAGIEQKTIELQPISFSAAVNFLENKKYLKYALPPVLLGLILLTVFPAVLTDSTKRLVAHSQEFSPVAPFDFVILNENLETAKNSSFTLRTKFEGEVIPDKAFVVINGNQFHLRKIEPGIFEYEFRNVRNDVKFQLLADGFYSDLYQLKTLAVPVLLNFDIHLDFPNYTGLENKTIRNTGNFTVPEGTKAEWIFSTENTEAMRVKLSDTLISLGERSRSVFTFSKELLHNTSYQVVTSNKEMTAPDTLQFTADVIKDARPTIEVNQTIDSTDRRRVYFDGIIGDDYGISALYFHYTLTPAATDSSGEIIRERIQVPIGKSLSQQFFYFWDLNRIKLNSGDDIAYYFEVWDNDGVNGAKSARSGVKHYKTPTREQLEQQNELTAERIKEKLKESLKEAKKLQDQVEKLNRELLQKKELNWQDKKRLEDLIEQQKAMQQNVRDIQQQYRENRQEQTQYNPQEERLQEKQQQIEELFDQLMSEEMKEKFRQLEELMEKLDKNKIQEQIKDIDYNAQEFEKELDRSLEIFKQMEFQQEYEEAVEKLEELSKEQEELAEETEQNQDQNKQEDLKQKQEELNDQFDQLRDDLKKLEELNKDLERPNEMPQTEQQQEQTQEQMENASEQMQQQQNKKASQSQQKAAENMQQMASAMQASMQQQQANSASEDMESIRALLENIIQLSFDQEEVMTQLRSVKRDDPQYVLLGQRQKKIQDDSKMVEDSLFALSKRVPQIQTLVNREIGLINQNIEYALSDISERMTASATSRQQYAMTSYNNLALLLDEALQQMQQQMASMMPGTGNCEKPGGMGQNPSSGKMSQRQEQMAKKLDQMKKAMEKGKKPGNKNPGGEQGQGMSEEIAKLAAEQAAIRREVEKMASEMRQRGQQSAKLLEEIAKQMEENERDLVNKDVSRETLKRQQEIVTRLLESEKAEMQREYENKRKSNEAQSAGVSNPEEYLEYKMRKQREVELLRTVPVDLKPYYRQRVNEYFIKFDQ